MVGNYSIFLEAKSISNRVTQRGKEYQSESKTHSLHDYISASFLSLPQKIGSLERGLDFSLLKQALLQWTVKLVEAGERS